ncbi:hypothetical protein ACM46_11855 [Chryseobacterium angstadtii]|uniref:Uncharacterized protein n=1 Tax=Chryseobacterium angstadtii TaxID=558151 RepID=A0A0J7IEL3_9FLAO|nr:hypothetical protein [Chryseobacterium angstadtii]KMQ64898.1 hypothetical protein ACM46_11855 [Chryseobacterium angstadtii]
MKKTLNLAALFITMYILNSCNDEKIVPEEVSLEQTMQVSRIGILDDKLSIKEKKELYKTLFANPEKFGFKKAVNDSRFDYFNRKGYIVYLRKLPNVKEENIVISQNISKQKKTPSSFFVFSFNSICSGIATENDPTENAVDDDCIDSYGGIINLDEVGSDYIEAYEVNGVTSRPLGQWVTMEAGTFSGGGGTFIQDIAEQLPDGWISMNY